MELQPQSREQPQEIVAQRLSVTSLGEQEFYENNLYPFCIVWTIFPCVGWILPWIGHTGICDSKGTIYDFLGRHINEKQMAFANPKKYVPLHIDSNGQAQTQRYNSCIARANTEFRQKHHDLCCNNCHHHVARVLNLLHYQDREDWNQVSIWWLCLRQGRYVRWWAAVQVYLPLIIIIAVATAIWLITRMSRI